MTDKIESLSDAALSNKEHFIKKYPDYKDWPYWDSNGYPQPPQEEIDAIIAKGLEVTFD
jgi:hypothetical protein